MATDPELRAHLEWLGYLQPVGLVVSAPALVASQAFVNRDILREQQILQGLHEKRSFTTPDGPRERTSRDPAAGCLVRMTVQAAPRCHFI